MILPILLLLALTAACAMLIPGIRLYRKAFSMRFDGGGDYYPYFSRIHPDLSRKSFQFKNDHADTLRGFLYYHVGMRPKALIVMVHGYGMSMDDYLPEADYLCSRGYEVLLFDGTGTGASEGVLGGMPQHILDLQCCLHAVGADPELSAFPLLLYGHSWGGYAVDCVSELEGFPIRGIVSASAFATSLAAIIPHGLRHYGPIAYLMLPGFKLYQCIKFGRCASLNVFKGLDKLTCPVLITQSDDDSIITYRDNYKRLYRHFKDDPRMRFLPLTGHNHNITTPREIDMQKLKLLKAIRREPENEENIREINRLKETADLDLLQIFADFYDKCLEDQSPAC